MLRTEQKHAYARDGFLVLEDFVSAEACDALVARAHALAANKPPDGEAGVFSTTDQRQKDDSYFLDSGDKIRFFHELVDGAPAPALNKIGHALHELDDVFSGFSRTDDLREIVADLDFHDPRLLQSMFIFKDPRVGGEVVWHQDATFLYTEPSTVTGLWFALADATIENGCLWALPGGHTQGLRARYVLVGDGRTETRLLDPTPWPDEDFRALEVAKGTLVVLNGMLPHGSAQNRSSRPRPAYTLHIIEGDAHYPDDSWLRRAEPPKGF